MVRASEGSGDGGWAWRRWGVLKVGRRNLNCGERERMGRGRGLGVCEGVRVLRQDG